MPEVTGARRSSPGTAGQTILTQLLELVVGGATPRVVTCEWGGEVLHGVLPDGWAVTTVDDHDDFAAAASDALQAGPVLAHASWGRIEGSRASPHQRDLPRIVPAGDHMLVVLIPAADLDARSSAAFREALLSSWSPRLVVQLRGALSGVHSGFIMAMVVLQPRGESRPVCGMLDASNASESDVDDVLSQARRLLRMQGGSTPQGYVLRELPGGLGQLGHRRNDPGVAARRGELAGYGSTTTLGELFDVGATPWSPSGLKPRDEQPEPEVPLLSGRHVQRNHVLRPDQDRRVPVRAEGLLRAGDVVLRAMDSATHQRGFTWSWVTADDLPLGFDGSVLALRPRSDVDVLVVEFVLRFLESHTARRLADASTLAGHIRLTARDLREMVVPVPDEPVLFALNSVIHARDVAAQWRDDAEDVLDTLFDGDTVAESRAAVLKESRSLRLRVTAAQDTQDQAHRVRSTYPLPVAARWRSAHTALASGASKSGYDALLDTAEVTLGYAASVGMALAHSAGVRLGASTALMAKFARGDGPDFGDWVAVLEELGGKRAQPIREQASADELCDFAAGCGAAIARLRQRRNDEAHGRPVDSHDLPAACDGALADVHLLLAGSQFLADMPLLLAGPTTWDTLSRSGSCEFRRLAGDHPVVPREQLPVRRPDIENESLYVQDTAGERHLLRPFVVAEECPTCRMLSTFHVDRVSGGVATLKSFEHGHLSDSALVVPALAAVGLWAL